jgi:hypothetical protein
MVDRHLWLPPFGVLVVRSLNRLIRAANSGLSKPESAASCASRRTAASCWLIVFAASPLDSRYMR